MAKRASTEQFILVLSNFPRSVLAILQEGLMGLLRAPRDVRGNSSGLFKQVPVEGQKLEDLSFTGLG